MTSYAITPMLSDFRVLYLVLKAFAQFASLRTELSLILLHIIQHFIGFFIGVFFVAREFDYMNRLISTWTEF